MTNVGEAWVKVHPNTDDFFNKLTKDVAKWGDKEENQPDVKLKPKIDDEAWEKERERFQKKNDKDTENAPTQKVRLKIADDDESKKQFGKELDQFARKLNKRESVKVKLTVDADTALAEAKIARLDGKHVRVQVEAVTGEIDQAKVHRQYAKMKEAFDKQQRTVDDAVGKTVPVKVGLDPRSAAVTLATAHEFRERLEQEVGQDLEIPVTLGRRGRDRLDGEIGDLKDKLSELREVGDVKIKLSVDEESNPLRDLMDGFDRDGDDFYKTVHIYPELTFEADDDGNALWDTHVEDLVADRDMRVFIDPQFKDREGNDTSEVFKALAALPERKKITLEVDVDGTGQAESVLQSLSRDRVALIRTEFVGDGYDSDLAKLTTGKELSVKVSRDSIDDLDSLNDELDQAVDKVNALGSAWIDNPHNRIEIFTDVHTEAAEVALAKLTRDRTVDIHANVTGAGGARRHDADVVRRDVESAAEMIVETINAGTKKANAESQRGVEETAKHIDGVATRVERAVGAPTGRRGGTIRSMGDVEASRILGRLGLKDSTIKRYTNTAQDVMELQKAILEAQAHVPQPDAREDALKAMYRNDGTIGSAGWIRDRLVPGWMDALNATRRTPASQAEVVEEVKKLREQVERTVTRPTARRSVVDYDAVGAAIDRGRHYAGKQWERELYERRVKSIDASVEKIHDTLTTLYNRLATSGKSTRISQLEGQMATAAKTLASGRDDVRIADLKRGMSNLSDVLVDPARLDRIDARTVRETRRHPRFEASHQADAMFAKLDLLGRERERLAASIQELGQSRPLKVAQVQAPGAVEELQHYLRRNADLFDTGFASKKSKLTGDASQGTDMSRAKIRHGADTWIKSAKATGVPRTYDSMMSAMMRKTFAEVFAAPGYVAKLFAGMPKKLSGVKGGGLGFKDATGVVDFGKGLSKGPSSKWSPSATGGGKSGALKGAGKAGGPLGMVLQAVAGVGAQGFRLSTMGGGIAVLIGAVTDALAGLSAMAVSILKPVGQLMQGVVVAPAALAQLATGIGAVALSFKGVGEALGSIGDPEKFAEALEELTPAARDFAQAVADVAEPFSEMRETMQEQFFDGMADSFTRMSDAMMPVLSDEWPKMAGAIGDMADSVFGALSTPKATEQMRSMFEGITDSFREMGPGMQAFTESFMTMAEVGAREALPALGRAFTDLGQWTKDYFNEQRVSSWIDVAKNGARELGGLTKDLWAGSADFLKAMADGADASFGEGGVWGAMRGAIADFREFAASDIGQAKIANFFEGATDSARTLMDIAGKWSETIVTDMIPATRDFLDKHGESIGNFGQGVLSVMTKMIGTLDAVVPLLANAAHALNETLGGPGSKKEREKLGKYADKQTESLDQKYKHQYTDNARGERFKQKDREALTSHIGQARERLSEDIGSVDTAEWQKLAAVMERAQVRLQQLEGGFDGARQSADATASVATMLGQKIVDIPDKKTMVIEADPGDRAVNALRHLGAQVDEIEGQPGKLRVEFQNEMEINGALEKITAEIQDLPDAEIQARGLDVAVDQLAELKAQLDGMTSANIAINVEAGQVDGVMEKLAQVGIAAQEVNGSIYIDTNAPDVMAKLEELKLAVPDAQGKLTLVSNIDEVLGELLGIQGQTITSTINVTQTGDTEPPKDSKSEHERHVTNTGEINPPPPSDSTHTRNVVNAGQVTPPGDSQSTHIRIVKTIMQNVGAQIGGVAGAAISAGMQANGSIVPAADGFASRSAMIARKGSYILWAENETEDESYIPHALSKRKRSTQILVETANRFGLGVVDRNGKHVERDGSSITPMADGGVKSQRSRELSELNKKRARAEALAKKRKQKPLTREELAEAARLEAELAAIKERSKDGKHEDVARKMTGYRDGKFIYTDVAPDAEGAVRAVDHAGLIPGQVRVASTVKDWDGLDDRSVGIINAMGNTRFRDEYKSKADGLQAKALAQGMDPAQVAQARRAVDGAMPLTDLPADVKHALLTGEDVVRDEGWHRQIDTERLFKPKRRFEDFDLKTFGRYMQGWYGDDLADLVELDARHLRDVPLYNMVNPDADAWNAVLADMRGGQHDLERKYTDRYQRETKIRRDAEKAQKEQLKGANKKQKTPKQLQKDVERELKREREQQQVRAAGMEAVHRARSGAATRSDSGGGVVVNQTIGNITAADAGDAASKFRRKTMVGFESLTGVV